MNKKIRNIIKLEQNNQELKKEMFRRESLLKNNNSKSRKALKSKKKWFFETLFKEFGNDYLLVALDIVTQFNDGQTKVNKSIFSLSKKQLLKLINKYKEEHK